MKATSPILPSIIVVEDNEMLRDELVLFLSEDGFDVRSVDTGDELNRAIRERPADILILDLNLPGEDGIAITRRLRGALPDVGIVILSARVRSTDRLDGYANGADVYLTKPTRPEELVAVVKNLFRRIGSVVVSAQWQLDMAVHSLLTPQGARIMLTSSEAILLQAFALNGQFMGHSALQTQFGDVAQSESTSKARIEVLISRLRLKLAPHISDGFDIKVVRGRGYQLGFLLAIRNPNSLR